MSRARAQLDQAEVPPAPGFCDRRLYASRRRARGLRRAARGFYDTAGKLRYAGKVGTAMTTRVEVAFRKVVADKKTRISLRESPREKGVQWVQPKLVAQPHERPA